MARQGICGFRLAMIVAGVLVAGLLFPPNASLAIGTAALSAWGLAVCLWCTSGTSRGYYWGLALGLALAFALSVFLGDELWSQLISVPLFVVLLRADLLRARFRHSTLAALLTTVVTLSFGFAAVAAIGYANFLVVLYGVRYASVLGLVLAATPLAAQTAVDVRSRGV